MATAGYSGSNGRGEVLHGDLLLDPGLVVLGVELEGMVAGRKYSQLDIPVPGGPQGSDGPVAGRVGLSPRPEARIESQETPDFLTTAS